MRHLIAALTLASCTSQPAPEEALAPLTLTGTIARADHQTYREIPFTVPPGAHSLTIDFTYDKDNRTVIDLGLRDPAGQRGWSGGNKSGFTVSEFTATPSYKPGKLQHGEWKLVLGIPNIREGETASYTATVAFNRDVSTAAPAAASSSIEPLTAQPGWYRGDLHTHTAHSDGSCDINGARQPCPTHRTANAALAARLDFVAITDHNTITQLADIQHLQPQYGKTLLIPGTEITTFHGHANVVGNTDFLDFQLGSPRLPTLAKLHDQVDAAGAFISINHPSLPSGEACMGCGWTVEDTDWSRVTAMEVINGASMRTSGPEGAFNGIAYWESHLKRGRRITAIGGSDNHDATDTTGARQSPVGKPATVVHAQTLSTADIIAGVKSGRVFIDAAGLPGAVLDLHVQAPSGEAYMGGELPMAKGEQAQLRVIAENLPADARVEFVTQNVDVTPAGDAYTLTLGQSPRFGWVRANVRDAQGKLLLMGNPVYLGVRPTFAPRPG